MRDIYQPEQSIYGTKIGPSLFREFISDLTKRCKLKLVRRIFADNPNCLRKSFCWIRAERISRLYLWSYDKNECPRLFISRDTDRYITGTECCHWRFAATFFLLQMGNNQKFGDRVRFKFFDSMQAVREAATICPRPLQVDLWPLTLKVVSESRVTWRNSVPILVFLGLTVLDLGPMYETDRRQTDVVSRQAHIVA